MTPRGLYALLLLTAAIPGAAQAPGVDVEANLRRIQELRETDREQYYRLRRNFERFRALSPDQQERLRRFDRELHELEPELRERLMHTLSEYDAWLARLPEADRQRVLAAAVPEERLKIIRALRDEQWARSQPPIRVKQWEQADASERQRLVAQWRQQERTEREEWAVMQSWEALTRDRPLMPVGPEAFRREVIAFVDKHLKPSLSPQEQAKVAAANYDLRRDLFSWLRAVVEVADAHPVLALQPKYLTRAELPEDYRRVLENPPADLTPELLALAEKLPAERRWPEYPAAVSRLMRQWKVPVTQQLGPSTAAEFSPAIEKVVESLPPADQLRLKGVAGLWPEYPLKLHEIARERKLVLPGLGLPGDPRLWERVRGRLAAEIPEPTEWQLRIFAMELARKNPEYRTLDLNNAENREKLLREYYKTRSEQMRRFPGMVPDRMRPGRRPSTN